MRRRRRRKRKIGEEVEEKRKDYSWKKTIMIVGPTYQARVPGL